jgi:YD repeat-containing protein
VYYGVGPTGDIPIANFIFPKTPCPFTQNFVAPGQCTIPSPNKNCGCSGDVMKGNPCNAASGNKFQTEIDLTSVDGSIPIIRYYNSQLMLDLGFGVGWTSSILGKRLYINPTDVQVLRADGRGESFVCNGGVCQGDTDTRIALTQDANGYTLTTIGDGAVERYDTAGKLVTETDRSGRTTNYSYDASGRLYTITGPFGHRLTLSYNANNHISQISGGAETPGYTYDANNNLIRVRQRSITTRILPYPTISPAFPTTTAHRPPSAMPPTSTTHRARRFRRNMPLARSALPSTTTHPPRPPSPTPPIHRKS